MRIEDFGYNGEGVARKDGKVCFVPYSLVGEEVEVEEVKTTSSYIKCRLEKIVEPSKDRQSPPCPYFAKCGGCDFQHISYEKELDLKKQILARHFAKLGVEKEIEVIASPREYGYRNKIKLFYSDYGLSLCCAGSNKLIPIKRCLLIDDEMNEVLSKVDNFLRLTHLRPVNVIIKRAGEKILLWFIFPRPQEVNFDGLALLLGRNCYIYKSVAGKEIECCHGQLEPQLEESGLLCAQKVEAFRQVNDLVASKLYDKAIKCISGEKVINAYSGSGFLSGLLVRAGKEVIAIELGTAEHRAAEKLKEDNNLSALTNVHGDCAEALPLLSDYDAIIVDPPRAGCDERVCEAIKQSRAKELIYISCNPATLIRDLSRLDTFKVDDITLFDMFPRTANFETLVKLTRK